jgi:hypothetical protein
VLAQGNSKMLFQNRQYSVRARLHRHKDGFSLLEAMTGMIIFFLLFGYTVKALAPTATDSHNLLRGVTVAMNACNWYLNDLEKRINYLGELPAADLGENDVTLLFNEDYFSDIAMLRNLQATSHISLEGDLYTMRIVFRWGNHDADENRPHNFELARLKTRPGI